MARKDWGFSEDTSPPWPKLENGQPVPPAYLTHLSESALEGPIVTSLLNSAGIPVVSQFPLGGEFGRIILGFSGTGRELYVPETLLEDAKELLASDFQEEIFDDVQD